MVGLGRQAEDKERWFMENFSVWMAFSRRRSRLRQPGRGLSHHIAHNPAALTAVMKLNGVAPDFAPRGSLSLKPWIANDQGLRPPRDLALPTVEAIAPYNEQIETLKQQARGRT